MNFSPRTIASTFKKYFENLVSDLVKKFPYPTGKFKYLQCASNTKVLTSVKKFEKVSSLSILKILKEFKANRAAGIDLLAGRFLKDGSKALCTPIGFFPK